MIQLGNQRPVDCTLRHELKYLITQRQMDILKSRLRSILQTDPHQSEKGYCIRSIYLDTAEDLFYEESLSGVEYRKKYRIRMYDGNDQLIRLEKKTSVRHMKTKDTVQISREETEKMIAGDYSWIKENWNRSPLLQEIYLLNKTHGLATKIIVEYNRYAFVSAIGNIRITFDQKIRTTDSVCGFFDKELHVIPILPDNRHVLEVKYTGVLPGFIVRFMNIGSLEQISFSKYGLCKNLIENNGRLEAFYEC